MFDAWKKRIESSSLAEKAILMDEIQYVEENYTHEHSEFLFSNLCKHPDAEDQHLFISAAESGHNTLLTFIIDTMKKESPSWHVDYPKDYVINRTALFSAVMSANLEGVKILLQHSANVNDRSGKFDLSLHIKQFEADDDSEVITIYDDENDRREILQGISEAILLGHENEPAFSPDIKSLIETCKRDPKKIVFFDEKVKNYLDNLSEIEKLISPLFDSTANLSQGNVISNPIEMDEQTRATDKHRPYKKRKIHYHSEKSLANPHTLFGGAVQSSAAASNPDDSTPALGFH